MKKYLLLILLCILTFKNYGQKAVIYKSPSQKLLTSDFQVFINGENCPVYDTKVAAITYFQLNKKCDVEIIVEHDIQQLDIRPLQLGIEAEVCDNKISFSLEKPVNLSIEINKNIQRPLFFFAKNPLTKIPDKDDPEVHFFEAGKVHEVGQLDLKSNKILFIEGGAVVKGEIIANDAKNISVSGQGILLAPDNDHAIRFDKSKNINIEGITIINRLHWTLMLVKSQKASVENIQIIGIDCCSDGIDIVASQDVKIDRVFIRDEDDCIALKAKQRKHLDGGNTDVKNIRITRSVFWNAKLGNALEIGFETQTDHITNVVFSDCDIIHVEGSGGVFTIHNGDRAVVSDITYQNIRIEDARGFLFDFKILISQYSRDKERGKIKNIYFKNINVVDGLFPSSLFIGYDKTHRIENVNFENVQILGRKITSPFQGNFYMENAGNFTFE